MGKVDGAWWGLQEACVSTWGHQGEPSEWSVYPIPSVVTGTRGVDLLEKNVTVQAGEPGFVGEPAWNGLRCSNALPHVPWNCSAEAEICLHRFDLTIHDHT